MTVGIGQQLVQAISSQDEAAIAACFAQDAELHALVPRGLRERSGAADIGSLIAGWFGDSSELDLVESRVEDVGDKLHVAYRFEGVEEGEPYVVEQHVFCTLAGEQIARADLVCSGFRPR